MQLGSDAILARAAQPGSLPARVPDSAGISIYEGLARATGAPFVYAMLARATLDRGDLARAQMFAQRLPDSPKRDDLLAEIALGRADVQAARRYFVKAGDIEAITRTVDALAPQDPGTAYRLESALAERLTQSGTHPDAVAEAYWRMGELAWQQSLRALAMRDYSKAIRISPLSEKYLLSAGFAAYELHEHPQARGYFLRVLAVDPASADAYAGLGMVALRTGDRAAALRYARRARALNAGSHALQTLDAELRG